MKFIPMTARFELVASIPWSVDGLRERVIPLELGFSADSEPRLVRLLPSLSRAADGTVWLLAADGIVGPIRNGEWSPFSLAAADAGEINDIAPLADGGLLVLGEKENRENVLVRFDGSGLRIWRRVGPIDHVKADIASLRGEYSCLRNDFDGTAYLPGTRLEGAVSRIDLSNGDTPATVNLGDFRGPVWIQSGVLFRVDFAEHRRWWVSWVLETGEKRKSFVEDELQDALAVPRSSLPSGGALLSTGTDLIRMGAQGNRESVVPLAGIVRVGDGLAVGLRRSAEIFVSFWQGGKETDSYAIGPVGPWATLINANHEEAMVRESGVGDQPESLTIFHRKDHRTSLGKLPAIEVFKKEGAVSTLKVLVEPDGALLMVGADAKGVYIVRVR